MGVCKDSLRPVNHERRTEDGNVAQTGSRHAYHIAWGQIEWTRNVESTLEGLNNEITSVFSRPQLQPTHTQIDGGMLLVNLPKLDSLVVGRQ